MFSSIQRFDSSEGNVWKYVFQASDAIAESVLYQYESFANRTVICCSVQSGCPIGCTFCGTGSRFIRNLTVEEIVAQVQHALQDMHIEKIDDICPKFQIMFMSMGEPMLNWTNVDLAIRKLNQLYPNAQLLLSTVGIDNEATWGKIIATSKEIDKVGLQFSIHNALEDERNKLIPFRNKLSLKQIRDMGMIWNKATGRNVFLNYCVDGSNNSLLHTARLHDLFSPLVFNDEIICG